MEDAMEVEAENDIENEDEETQTLADENALQGPSQPTLVPLAEEDDGGTCPVCLEAWTNSGDHRICSLKCGHLFGHKCILRWLDSQPKKNCPTCKTSVKRSDLRFIYAKKLIAIDNMELENALQQLEDAKRQLENALTQKNVAMQTVSKYIGREQAFQTEIDQLRKRIRELTLGIPGSRPLPLGFRRALKSTLNQVRLYMEKAIDVCNKSGCRDCRVFDISATQDLILVGSRSPTDLFGGFGLKKLSLANYKPIKFIPLHTDPIRDMCIHPVENRVLTVSTDKTFRITDTQSTQRMYSVTLDSAPWACSWSPSSSDELFVGTQNGTVSVFDIRNLGMPKLSLTIPGDFSPVVALTGVREESNDILLVAKLNSVWAFERYPDGTLSRHLLPLEGPFLSLRYDEETKQVLVSSRPNTQIAFARHTVCKMEKTSDPDTISCNIVYTFKGGNTAKLLAKTSCFLANNLVAGHHETRKSILLFSVNTGEEVGSCPTHDNLVLDMKGLDTPSGKFLTYLNEKKMEFFKFNT